MTLLHFLKPGWVNCIHSARPTTMYVMMFLEFVGVDVQSMSTDIFQQPVRVLKTAARKCSYLRSLRTLPDQPVPLQRARPIVVKAGWDVLDRIALLLSLFLLLAQLHSSGAPACGADYMLRCH